MKTMLILIASVTLPLAAGWADQAGAAPRTAAAQAATPIGAKVYVAEAGAGDLFEIESSRLALQKSKSEGVRRFAQMMIDHHTNTTRTLTASARKAGVALTPPRLTAMQQKMLEQLRSQAHAGFDAVYLQQQRQAHQMALTLHQTYAQDGDTPALQQAARAAVPIIKQHIQELDRL